MNKERPFVVSAELFEAFHFAEIARDMWVRLAAKKEQKCSRVLVKGLEFSMILTALKKGARFKEHYSPAPATGLVLEGCIDFKNLESGIVHRLGVLESAVFSSEILHSIEAASDALLLLVFGQHKKLARQQDDLDSKSSG